MKMEKSLKCLTCENKEESPLCSFPAVVEEIDRVKVVSYFKPGDHVFRSGEFPLGLFTVQHGLVKLESMSEGGNAHTLRIIGPGGVMGHRSLFASEPYAADAIAVEESAVCFVPKLKINELFLKHPEVAMSLLCHLSKDLRVAESKWVDQIDKEAPQRVAEALLFLTEHFDHTRWTRKEIAQWAGTTTETVIRTLSQFEKDQIIDQSQRQIKILRHDSLKEKALAR